MPLSQVICIRRNREALSTNSSKSHAKEHKLSVQQRTTNQILQLLRKVQIKVYMHHLHMKQLRRPRTPLRIRLGVADKSIRSQNQLD